MKRPPQGSELVDRNRGIVRLRMPRDQLCSHQPGECLRERLVCDLADRRAQFHTSVRSGAEHGEHHAVPTMAEEIGRRSDPTISNQPTHVSDSRAHRPILVGRHAPFGASRALYGESMTSTPPPSPSALRIAIIGSGNVARALSTRWVARGHLVAFSGRSDERARSLAAQIGQGAVARTPARAIVDADVVLLAVPWSSIDEVLVLADAAAGALGDKVVIDPTNPVQHGVGRHLLDSGSAAEHIAARAPRAHVVKAFNVFPAEHWARTERRDVVLLAGDPDTPWATARTLVSDTGATPHVLGGLDRARQLEELAGAVIAAAFGGIDPRSVVPGF